jgi:hypothetical protein
MAIFFKFLTDNPACGVDCNFFLSFFTQNVLTETTPLPGGYNPGTPSERVMETLGSSRNDQQFRLL